MARRRYTNLARLYAVERITNAEASPEFISAQDNLTRRKAASEAAAEKAKITKLDKLLAQIAAMEISVERIEIAQLQKMAIADYNAAHKTKCFSVDSIQSDDEFLQRICVNFARHNLTEYDYCLSAIRGKAGERIGVDAIRNRFYAAIATTYPELKDECDRQLSRREDETLLAGCA